MLSADMNRNTQMARPRAVVGKNGLSYPPPIVNKDSCYQNTNISTGEYAYYQQCQRNNGTLIFADRYGQNIQCNGYFITGKCYPVMVCFNSAKNGYFRFVGNVCQPFSSDFILFKFVLISLSWLIIAFNLKLA